MGRIRKPASSKLFIGLIYREPSLRDQLIHLLIRRFGNTDIQSPELDFNYTGYYYEEFGRPLKRYFVAFRRLRSEDGLAGIKIFTNSLEKRFSRGPRRQINLDPGFLSLGKIVLATTKDHNHRVYLGKGIFAEVTLFYQDKTYNPWPWTYPDYRSREYIDFFNSTRCLYSRQIKDASPIS